MHGCPPLEIEVNAINASLPSWDDVMLSPLPRLPGPLHVAIVPKHPQDPEWVFDPCEPTVRDLPIREAQCRWAAGFLQKIITERMGHSDWGKVCTHYGAARRCLQVTVECYEVVEQLGKIVDAARAALGQLRHRHTIYLSIDLRVPPPKPTAAQEELYERFQREQDRADFERRQEEHREQLDNQYLYQLQQQEGEPIDPAEFAPSPKTEPPPAPWEVESEDEDEDDPDAGDLAVKKKPAPPPQVWDDEHPLADNYTFCASVDEERILIYHRFAALGLHLLHRQVADEVIPEEAT